MIRQAEAPRFPVNDISTITSPGDAVVYWVAAATMLADARRIAADPPIASWKGGDPAKLAVALVKLAALDAPPARLVQGRGSVLQSRWLRACHSRAESRRSREAQVTSRGRQRWNGCQERDPAVALQRRTPRIAAPPDRHFQLHELFPWVHLLTGLQPQPHACPSLLMTRNSHHALPWPSPFWVRSSTFQRH